MLRYYFYGYSCIPLLLKTFSVKTMLRRGQEASVNLMIASKSEELQGWQLHTKKEGIMLEFIMMWHYLADNNWP